MPKQVERKHSCPRCGKPFEALSSVLNHMNQLKSKCRFLHENVIHFQNSSFRNQGRSPIATEPVEIAPASQTLDPSSEEMNPEDVAMYTDDQELPGGRPIFDSPRSNSPGFFCEEFSGAARIYGKGKTFMDHFDMDEHARKRVANLYYPFATRSEWQLASFLLRSDLSMSAIDEFLKLAMVQEMHLSFRTAKDLRSRAEILPLGPRWLYRSMASNYPTKRPIHLYYRNPLECLESLLNSPLLRDHIKFKPFRLFETAEKLMRVYTEWLSGDAAWYMQDKLPHGSTLLGTILSSDKTNISNMTGGRVAHPLLISLANISMEFRNRASNHAFLLLALLPVPKFLHRTQKIRGVLEARLYHECLDFILQPLKIAAQIGVLMADPVGALRWCFTILASFIVDTPEAALIAGVAGKTSPVTLASFQQFGDPFRHPPRLARVTLQSLAAIRINANPSVLEDYVKEAMKYRLNGVHLPFWRDWVLSDPSVFLTSEPLHHWHKQFWDHDAKWCIFAVGAAEIDFRFSILHPRTGYRHFHEGISSLKQVTGREHRDMQRYLISVIADAVPSPFLVAIRSLLDFRYLAQAKVITEGMCRKIEEALQSFHSHKHAILASGARRGKKGPINNWEIPKLEFLQSVVSNIHYNGAAIQWSADTTEFAHIPLVKDPARSGNNQSYEPQICRNLDRSNKLELFDLATSIRSAGIVFESDNYGGGIGMTIDGRETMAGLLTEDGPDSREDLDEEARQTRKVSTTADLLSYITSVSALPGSGLSTHGITDYFRRAKLLQCGTSSNADRVPHRTCQSSASSVFHLSRDPQIRQTPIDIISDRYGIPDLRPAIADYVARLKADAPDGHISSLGGRRLAKPGCYLPVTHLEVWQKVRLQNTAYHFPHDILPPKTINAAPPSEQWLHGFFDSVIVNINTEEKWPESGLKGHVICDLRLVFRILPARSVINLPNITDRFLCYVQRYDVIPQSATNNSSLRGFYPHPSSGLHALKRSKRANGDIIGDIVPLDQLRALADVTPRFGPKADQRFTKENCLHYSTEFWLNKYFDKELFYALDQY